jgi:sugar phosphate isomerase/epimerase
MIRFSCSEYTFPLLPRDRRFALLRLLGFNYVDLGLFERSSDLKPSQRIVHPATFTKNLKAELERAGLLVSDIFVQTGTDPEIASANDSDPSVRAANHEAFLAALELCAALDCPHITGLPGVWHDGVQRAGDFALAVEEGCWRERAAARASVRYSIEPHLGSICADVASTRSFLDAVPGLTLTLDYGHFVAAGFSSGEVHPLLPCASHIHVRGGARKRLQTAVSENEIDFGGMVRGLEEQNYRGFLAVEYVWTDWQDCNRSDNVSETILLRRRLEELMRSNPEPPSMEGE